MLFKGGGGGVHSVTSWDLFFSDPHWEQEAQEPGLH